MSRQGPGMAADGLPPLGEAHDGHPHERDVVATEGKGLGVRDCNCREQREGKRKPAKKTRVSHQSGFDASRRVHPGGDKPRRSLVRVVLWV